MKSTTATTATDASSGYVDTLRLSKSAWADVLELLQRQGPPSVAADKRTANRYVYRNMMGLAVEMIHPGGTRTRYLVRSRDISQRGIRFLHGAFVHVGTRCEVILVSLKGDAVHVSGTVMRCQHMIGKVHDIGIRLDKPVNVRTFCEDAIEEHAQQEAGGHKCLACGGTGWISAEEEMGFAPDPSAPNHP